jgi:hypothetical protein
MQSSLWSIVLLSFGHWLGFPCPLKPPCQSPLLYLLSILNPRGPYPAAPLASPSQSFSGRPLTMHTWEITSNCPVLIPVQLTVLAGSVHLPGAELKE